MLANPWDAGSARLFERLGFPALASTSSGFSWTLGRADYELERDTVLAHLASLCAAVGLPVNADFESGFASDAEGVAANVALAVDTGVAGLSIEDRVLDGAGLYDTAVAVERLRAARAAIDRSGHDVLLVGRTEGLLDEPRAVGAAIDRLVAYADAGADCLYAPGLARAGDIRAVVAAVAPKPVNVLMSSPAFTVAALANLGVRRVSVGGALARVAWSAVAETAGLLRAGSFEGFAKASSHGTIDALFGPEA